MGLDSDALATVAAAAGDGRYNVVETVDTSKLSESQQAVLGIRFRAIVVDVSIMAQGTAISHSTGTSQSACPMNRKGFDTSKLVVWYLADDDAYKPGRGCL